MSRIIVINHHRCVVCRWWTWTMMRRCPSLGSILPSTCATPAMMRQRCPRDHPTRDTRQLRQVGSIPPSTCVTPAMMPRPRDHPYPRYSLTQTGRQYLALYLRHPSYDAAAMPSGPPAHCNDHFAKSELCKFLQNGWTNFVHFCHAESS